MFKISLYFQESMHTECALVHTYIHTHTHTHTYIYIYIHTHTNTLLGILPRSLVEGCVRYDHTRRVCILFENT